MVDMQTATEAAKAGSGVWVNVALDSTLIAAVIGALTKGSLWGKPKNGQRPGFSPKCIDHGEQLAVVKSKQLGYDEDLKEIKGDVKELLQRIPKRD